MWSSAYEPRTQVWIFIGVTISTNAPLPPDSGQPRHCASKQVTLKHRAGRTVRREASAEASRQHDTHNIYRPIVKNIFQRTDGSMTRIDPWTPSYGATGWLSLGQHARPTRRNARNGERAPLAQCEYCFYAAGPQTGVVLDVSPRTAMCVRNVDVQMCPAVHTMTRS